MKTNKLILLGLICLTVAMPTTAQNRNEKKERTERAVKEAIAAKQYKINVDRMQPMRGGGRIISPPTTPKLDHQLHTGNQKRLRFLLPALLWSGLQCSVWRRQEPEFQCIHHRIHNQSTQKRQNPNRLQDP